MTVFESIKSKNIEELAEWLDEYGMYDGSPWMNWFDDNYCNKCEAEVIYIPEFKRECDCAWCELHHKCKHFLDMNDIPNNKQIIKMWLELDSEEWE